MDIQRNLGGPQVAMHKFEFKMIKNFDHLPKVSLRDFTKHIESISAVEDYPLIQTFLENLKMLEDYVLRERNSFAKFYAEVTSGDMAVPVKRQVSLMFGSPPKLMLIKFWTKNSKFEVNDRIMKEIKHLFLYEYRIDSEFFKVLELFHLKDKVKFCPKFSEFF